MELNDQIPIDSVDSLGNRNSAIVLFWHQAEMVCSPETLINT